METPIEDAAKRYLQLGLCALPANAAEKRPIGPVSWGEFQTHPPTVGQLGQWFSSRRADSVCLVGGDVSGCLEVIDFDLKAEFFPRWRELVESEAPGLVARLLIERSQSGGKHAIYRCPEGVGKSTKLAQRDVECTAEGMYSYAGKEVEIKQRGDQWIATLTFIETKAEGGLFLCHPSPGYELEQGSFETIPLVTASERDILLTAAKSLNEVIREVVDYTPSGPVGDRPGDDFNRHGDWRSIVEKHGWQRIQRCGPEYWRRPGKVHGCSARFKDGFFCVYSCNAAPFEEGAGYSPFRVYALLEHRGDFSAAAKALAQEGFGGGPVLPPCEEA